MTDSSGPGPAPSAPLTGRSAPPRWFWPVTAFALCVMAVIWYGSLTAPAGDAEYQFRQKQLESSVRLTEGTPLYLSNIETAEEDRVTEPDPETMAVLITQAREQAADEESPAQYREQAAAVWLALTIDPETSELTAMLPPTPERTALGHWLAGAVEGEGLTDEAFEPLDDESLSPWLYGRIRAWAAKPNAALDPDSTHAQAQIPWLSRAYALVATYGLAFLTGELLILVAMIRLRRDGRIPMRRVSAWAPVPWIGWGTMFAWFSMSSAIQLPLSWVLADASQTATAAGMLGSQVLAGSFVLWLVSLYARRPENRSVMGAITDLRVGLSPFGGAILPPVGLGLAGISCAVTLVTAVGFIQTMLPLESDLVSNPIMPELVSPESPLSQLILLAAVTLCAPFFEEIVFRGVLYSQLRERMSAPAAIGLSAAVFAFAHYDVGSLLPLFALACVLAATAEYTKGLLVPMLIHGLWNAGSVVGTVLMFG